jgi:diguanylate cyclase (GGDEF)-like protein
MSLTTLQRLLARWRAEHVLVAAEAAAVNLTRARTAGWVVALLDALIVLVLATLATAPAADPVERWRLGLLLVHLAMGLTMLLLSLAAHRLRFIHPARLGRGLPVLLAAVALAFAIGITTVDQWVTPNITPLLIGAMAISMAICLRPLTALALFLTAYLLFFFMIGLTQTDADRLLSNRINGLVALALAWALSVTLWRNFTLLTLQRMQLEATNAELQTKQKELQRLTRLDGLTGLYNRNTFVELTRQELARAQRQGSATSILLLDLDFFKRINDTWGHPAGDAVLKNVAVVANSTVRATDLVGRLGGEEFIILLPNTSVEAARRLAEKLRANLENSPLAWEQTSIKSTASFGVASTTALENHDFDHLYSHADKALYTAKEKGRNRVV